MSETTEVQEVEGTEVEVAGEALPVPAGYDPAHVDITPKRLAARVYQFGKGNYQVTDLDAKGIKTIALRCGISVTSCKFKETSDGKGYFFTAKGINLVTKQKAVDHCFQTKTLAYDKGYAKKGDFDEDAVAKGSTRVIRRLRRQLIPEEIIDQAIEWAIIGSNTEDAVATARKAAEEARNNAKQKMKGMGINARLCYEDAQQNMGPAENWGASEWYALRDKYLDVETEFAHLAKQQQRQQAQQRATQPEPVPDTTDRDKAIKDVQAAAEKVKADANIAPIVIDESGGINRSLIYRWFLAPAQDLDVGQLRDLVSILETLLSGDYSHLPEEQRPKPQTAPQATPPPSAAPQPDETVPVPTTKEVLAGEIVKAAEAFVTANSQGGWTVDSVMTHIMKGHNAVNYEALSVEELTGIKENLETRAVDYLNDLIPF